MRARTKQPLADGYGVIHQETSEVSYNQSPLPDKN
jgi:hypothetical protein